MELFSRRELPEVRPGPLAPLAEQAAARLTAAGQTVAVFEATTGGLIQAALQAVPGASKYTTCGAITYSRRRAAALLGADLSIPRPANGEAYKESKNAWTSALARRMRREVGSTWCISESGACGPTFDYPVVSAGFTSVFVSGPVEKGAVVESPHAGREENMWAFAKLALDLLAECVEEAAGRGAPAEEAPALLAAKEDRFGGVEAEVPAAAAAAPAQRFEAELRRGLEAWQGQGKKGIWLKIPTACARFVGPAVEQGFAYHHARPEYALLTRWLPETPSPLPRHGFTQIGVGGVVLNQKGEVLMVQERVAPLPQFQGSWKLPGGLADPGENFAETAQREVLEETGISSHLEGIVSLRHTHGVRFNQGDIYVVARLRADREEIVLDPHELQGAQWMSPAQIEALVVDPSEPQDGKVSSNNWKVICKALEGALIAGAELPNSRGPKPSMLYTAPSQASAM